MGVIELLGLIDRRHRQMHAQFFEDIDIDLGEDDGRVHIAPF